MNHRPNLKLLLAGVLSMLIGAGLALKPELSIVGVIFLALGLLLAILSDPGALLR